MHITESAITAKTRELCQVILDQPDFASIRRRVDAFMVDDAARNQFQALNEKGEFLNHKQHQGMTLSDTEVADFEKDRDSALQNPVIRGFLEAQQAMHRIQESVDQHLIKLFELGRVPQPEDLQCESCDPNCSCGHEH